MNVSTLRAELAELERAGYGNCRALVYPALSEDEATNRYILDFTGQEFTVCQVEPSGWPANGFVALVFDMAEEQDEPVLVPGASGAAPETK